MLIAGNWKMNTTLPEARQLTQAIVEAVGSVEAVEVVLCPPFISLDAVREMIDGSHVRLGAQDMFHKASGAYTGEVSATMLQSVGCDFVILGHSERRQYFGETDRSVHEKALAALEAGLVPIICVGETLEERKAGRERVVVETQVRAALEGLTAEGTGRFVIAYEPVWAIGTGETATPEQAQEMHRFIRDLLAAQFGEAATSITLLYGGSMKPDNAADLLGQPDVDGGLIGGASLKADSFAALVQAALTIDN